MSESVGLENFHRLIGMNCEFRRITTLEGLIVSVFYWIGCLKVLF